MKSTPHIITAEIVTKKPTPWLAMLMYSLISMINWLYAYLVQALPEIIINSWSLFFPIISYFYLVACVIAIVGISRRTGWGFGLGYITIILGVFSSAISYLLAFKIFPLVHTLFILLLVLNLLVILFMMIYSERHP